MYISTLFLLHRSILWICHNLFIHPCVDGDLGCFQFACFMNVGLEHSCICLPMNIGAISLVYIHVGVEVLASLTFNVYFSLCKAVASVDGRRCHTCAEALFAPYQLTELTGLNLVVFTWLPYVCAYSWGGIGGGSCSKELSLLAPTDCGPRNYQRLILKLLKSSK